MAVVALSASRRGPAMLIICLVLMAVAAVAPVVPAAVVTPAIRPPRLPQTALGTGISAVTAAADAIIAAADAGPDFVWRGAVPAPAVRKTACNGPVLGQACATTCCTGKCCLTKVPYRPREHRVCSFSC